MPKNDWSSFLNLGGGISISAFSSLGSGLEPSHDIISLNNGMLVHLKWYFSFFSFRLAFLQISSTLSTVLSWPLPRSSRPVFKISLVMPNTLVSP